MSEKKRSVRDEHMNIIESTRNEGSEHKPEDVQFIEFAKNYIGLLATVASIPILSAAIGVLPPPPSELTLKFLSSLLCLITFGASFLLRPLLGRLALAKNVFVRILPFLLVLILTIGAVALTSYYISVLDETGTNQTGIDTNFLVGEIGIMFIYLVIYPLFVLALAIVLVTSFSLQKSQSIQTIVDVHLIDDRELIRTLLWELAEYRQLARHNPPLANIGQAILNRRVWQLEKLSRGEVDVPGTETPRIHGLLLEHFSKRFDAVSDRDMNFWLRRENAEISREYARRLIHAIEGGTIVTRIFLVSDEELKNEDDLCNVLEQQHKTGIGWAVASYEELGKTIQESEVSIDFAIFEANNSHGQTKPLKAVSLFREYREPTRRFAAIFQTPNNEKRIEAQEKMYRSLVIRCWLANKFFVDTCKPFKEEVEQEPAKRKMSTPLPTKARIRNAKKKLIERLALQGDPHYTKMLDDQEQDDQVFLLEVKTVDEIKDKVIAFRDLREKSKVSLDVTDDTPSSPPTS